MSEVGQHPDEKRFEDHIEKHLNAIGFKSIDYNKEIFNNIKLKLTIIDHNSEPGIKKKN